MFLPPGLTASGGLSITARMKYNYLVPASTYSRTFQYTPTYHTASHYSPSHYTPTLSTSTYTSVAKYSPTQYSSTYSTPALSTYKTASAYVPPSYSKTSRYTSTRRTQAQENPVPVIPVAPAKRTVHFPNDIVFQDIVRRGDLEQIGRFMRARKVRVDALFNSGKRYRNPKAEIYNMSEDLVCSLLCAGMAALHEAVLTGNLEVVKLLVKYGADVHQRDEDGWTPLHMACSDGYPEIAR